MRWLSGTFISITALLFIGNAVFPFNRRHAWPLGEYSMYSPVKDSADRFTEFVLYGMYVPKDKSNETIVDAQEIMMEDSDYILPFTWDELRKSLRNMIELDKMDKVKRGLRKLIKRNSLLRHKNHDAEMALVGFRLYKETWLIDPEHFTDRGAATTRRLLLDERFD